MMLSPYLNEPSKSVRRRRVLRSATIGLVLLCLFAAPAAAGKHVPFEARAGLDIAEAAARVWAQDAFLVYVENDEERQRVLIAAGWEFYRIKYSDWINENFDKEGLISEITELLK